MLNDNFLSNLGFFGFFFYKAFYDLLHTFHKQVTNVPRHVFVILLWGILTSPLTLHLVSAVNMSSVMCTPESDGLSNYLYVFMLGQFLHGFGGTVLYSIGIVFIDANVRTTDSPMYQGQWYTPYEGLNLAYQISRKLGVFDRKLEGNIY